MIHFIEFYCRKPAAVAELQDSGPMAFFSEAAEAEVEAFLLYPASPVLAKTSMGYARALIGAGPASLYGLLVRCIHMDKRATAATRRYCSSFARGLVDNAKVAGLRGQAAGHTAPHGETSLYHQPYIHW